MDCPICESSMQIIKNLMDLPAIPYSWYKYSNYLKVNKVYYCEQCRLMVSFGQFQLIIYYFKNIIKEVKSMLGF